MISATGPSRGRSSATRCFSSSTVSPMECWPRWKWGSAGVCKSPRARTHTTLCARLPLCTSPWWRALDARLGWACTVTDRVSPYTSERYREHCHLAPSRVARYSSHIPGRRHLFLPQVQAYVREIRLRCPIHIQLSPQQHRRPRQRRFFDPSSPIDVAAAMSFSSTQWASTGSITIAP